MSHGHTFDIEAAFPQIPTQFDTDSGSAIPVLNVIEILGDTVANATFAEPVFTTGSGNTVEVNVQVAAAITGAPADRNDAGLASFDDTQFTVDANGFVQLAGGGAGIDSLTGDDAVEVSPDVTGNIDLLGVIVANATNPKPLFVDGDAASNKLDFELQLSTELGAPPADSNDAGIASFHSGQFSVDANGFVELVGGGGLAPILTQTGDAGGAVGPDGSGNVDWNGVTVANAANAKPVFVQGTPGSNLMEIDVQVATEITGSPADANDAGLSSYNDTQFTVDANGYVELVGGTDLPAIQTITSDDPTAVGPDASGNIDLTGEAVANATNAKPIFVDAGTNALNVEVQVATAIASAPGDKNDAGIASFDSSQFTVDTDGFVQLSDNANNTISISNLGFDLASGVFTITSADGTALSSSNPGFVTIWKREASDPGKTITIKITSNVNFNDATSASGSDITGNLFGTATGVAFSENCVFGVKAVLNDAEDAIAFMLSRNLFGETSPSAADIGAPDDPVADEQNDFWSFDNIDETLYDGNPSMLIGTIYMTKDASDDWTIAGLFSSGSGLNYPRVFTSEALSNWFRSEEGHFGAATGSFMIDNGGTAPTFTTQYVRYQYAGPQTMRVQIYMTGNTATDGAGAVNARIAIPYSVATDGAGETAIIGQGYVVSPAYTGIVIFEGATNETYVQMRDINGNLLANQDFSDGSRTVVGTLLYRTGGNP